MTETPSSESVVGALQTLRQRLHGALANIKAALDQAERLLDGKLAELGGGTVGEPLIPDTIHDHRPGGSHRLNNDPEQRAFIEARFGHMSYTEIAAAAAIRFGEDRALKRSAIHAWHRRAK